MDKRWLYRVWRLLPSPLQWAFLWSTNQKFLVGVLGLVVDGRGRVLLLRHDYRREGQWGLPGGQVKGHERLEEGLARELYEETGLKIEVGPIIEASVDSHVPRLDLIYRCRVVGGELALSDEIAKAGYFAPDELPGDMYPDQMALIRRVLAENVEG